VDEARLRMGYWLNPPEEQVFVPQGAGQPAGPPAVTVVAPSAPLLTQTFDSPPSPTSAYAAAAAVVETQPVAPPPSPTPAATATPMPLPPAISLEGVRYEDQHGRWNYCAPSNLSMALSYWGWQGNRDVVGPALKPLEKDKNVMPYEMVNYVNEQTGVRALSRFNGDLETLKRFLAANYPVLVEKGVYLRDLTGVVSWMGHYQVVTGYDDAAQQFTAQDSFVRANMKESYADFIKDWRSFNYTYIILYPQAQEAEVLALLGPDANAAANAQRAAARAQDEIAGQTGMQQYFAWYNLGTSLVELNDYANAATAYDESFKVYATLGKEDRPWRMLWYQTGPYFAYYHSGRYQDVINLADQTLKAMQSDKNLEESYYWRGMAKAALGDTAGAKEDLLLALQFHPGFPPAAAQLQQLGAQP
jgi:tetratricopeptide (TPR) repeat protein